MRSFMKKALIVATVFVVPAAVAGVSWWSATVTTDGLAPESMRAELASGILRDWSGEAAARKGTSALTWSTAMQSTLRNADIANRVLLADLDAFAHDLHAFFTVGKPFVANSAQIHPMRARAATTGAA